MADEQRDQPEAPDAGLLLRAAVASMPGAGVVLFDADLRIRAGFGSVPGLDACDPAAAGRRRIQDLVEPGARTHIGSLCRRALAGETAVDVRDSADGRSVYEITFGPAVDAGDIVGALAVVRDVTAEQRRLVELTATDELHRLVVDNIGDVIVLTGADGEFAWVSPSARRVLGWNVENILGHSVYELVHPEDRAALRAVREEALSGREHAMVISRVAHPRGGWTWVESRLRRIVDAADAPTGLLSTVRDITERRELETRLARAVAMFELAFDQAPIGMALVGVDGSWLKVNTALCALLQRSGDDLLRGSFQQVTHPDDIEPDERLMHSVLAGARSGYRMEKRYLRPDGSVVWAQLSVALVRDDAGAPQMFISQIEDLTERKRALAELQRQATRDPLTGLPNRVLLMDRLRTALAAAERGGWQVGVLFVDLDRFKPVNDTYGHDVGDALLRAVADRLLAVTRPGDTITRLGGDEFVVVRERVRSRADLTRTADGFRTALAAPFDVLGHRLHVTASVGYSVAAGGSAELVLRAADHAMYGVKQGGRDAGGVTDLETADRAALADDLAGGLQRGEFRPFYQPIVTLEGGGPVVGGPVVAREALVRWHHPTRGLLSPAAFVPIVDRSSLAGDLGATMLRQACAHAAAWPAGEAVHVNISPRHLALPRFADDVTACLARSGLAPHRLVVEITENLVLTASPATLTTADRLVAAGVQLCLDDFGTGYSSLTSLREFPIASVKIDRSFVADVLSDPVSAALVESVIALAARLGLGLVAEGVETPEQAAWLADHGCPRAQGFLFGRPLPDGAGAWGHRTA
jgi:diguanylate cyclase (GGDEF)-like protein/PAS domain S-box-containing protein